MSETIVTLATVPAILALVNLAKTLGLSGRWSALVAVLLGVGISLAEIYAPATLWQGIAGGVLLGLGAAGLYDMTATEPIDNIIRRYTKGPEQS